MKRRVPKLAAAFVVTFSALGCGPAEPPKDPEPIHRNPPGPEPEPTAEPTATSTFADPPATAAPTATSTAKLEEAPQGWRVEPNADGTCTAYGPDPCNHPGCNPPRPRKVACPPEALPTKPKK